MKSEPKVGISRIIERVTAKSDFIDANQLNDIFEQMISWSLYQLNGAPTSKTIIREKLPEEFMPEDDAGSNENTTKPKRKKPVTRRRFQPTSDMSEVNLDELSQSLPWLDVSSSESESDTGKFQKSPSSLELEKCGYLSRKPVNYKV